MTLQPESEIYIALLAQLATKLKNETYPEMLARLLPLAYRARGRCAMNTHSISISVLRQLGKLKRKP